jgi:hypothetical protein
MRRRDGEGARLARTKPAIYYWGVFILVAGLVSAALIFAFATDDAELAAADEIAGGRAYQHNIELMGGKFAVLSVEFDRWFASLWHGRPLAYTVAVLSVAVTLLCFGIARMLVNQPKEEQRTKQD